MLYSIRHQKDAPEFQNEFDVEAVNLIYFLQP